MQKPIQSRLNTQKDTRTSLQLLILFTTLCQPLNGFAQVDFTDVDGSILHSQYHPNPESKFKGTIIFENGSEISLREWTENKSFLKCIKEQGNVFLYDRSGLGKSPQDFSISLKKPTTAQLVNSKLMKLLRSKQIKAPYILIAHSYGGLDAGYFARKHPDSVVGMLMVDPEPSAFEYSDQIQEKFKTTLTKLIITSGSEEHKSFGFTNSGEDKTLTAEAFYQHLGFAKTKKQVGELPPMSNKFPIIIASSSDMNQNAPIKGDWYALQKQWLNRNPNSANFKVRSDHFIQISRPELICEQLNKRTKKPHNLPIKTTIIK